MEGPGFNVFVNGVVAGGRTGTALRVARLLASDRPRPCDRAYVHNHAYPQRPRALALPPGIGVALGAALFKARQSIWNAWQELSRPEQLRRLAPELIVGTIEAVRTAFPLPQVRAWLGDAKGDLLGIVPVLVEGTPDGPALLRAHLDHLDLNLIADRSETIGAPVIVENYPTHSRLFGVIEPNSSRGSAPRADYRGIRGGSLLEADGGFLILQAADLIAEPRVWSDLTRVLRSGELEIASESWDGPAAAALQPEPLRIEVKVILIGDPRTYQQLQDMQPSLHKVFKITADFEPALELSDENLAGFARMVARLGRDEHLPPFDASALAELVTWGARRVDSRERMSAELSETGDLVREAAFITRETGRSLVGAEDVRAAIRDGRQRAERVEKMFLQMFREGALLLDTEGAQIGRVNGLSTYEFGYHRFGKPTRITASAAPGDAGIINIEREARLSGSVYDKGVLVISGYLRRRFSRQGPLALTASLAFEQSYAGVDGDSASIAEVAALLSDVAGIPVMQSVAVTGSINQHGEVQPVGGVNEKIEGFYDVCRLRGLTGDQGVIVPERNVDALILREDVIGDLRAGRFHLWWARAVDDALEVLFDMPRDDIEERVSTHLDELRTRAGTRGGRDGPPVPVTPPIDMRPALPGTAAPAPGREPRG